MENFKYPTRDGNILYFLTNSCNFEKFGVYPGEALDTPRGRAYVVGVQTPDGPLWIHFDDSTGAEIVDAKSYSDLFKMDILRIPTNDIQQIRNHNKRLIDMLDIYNDKQMADIVFIADNKELKAHKCVLVQRSEYFKKLFSNNMIESSGVIKSELSYTALEKVIRYLYVEILDNISDPFIFSQVVLLADMYIIENLQKDCIDFIKNFKNCSDILIILLNCVSIEYIKNTCYQQIFNMWEEIKVTDEFYELLNNHPNILKDIIMKIPFADKKKIVHTEVEQKDRDKILSYLRQISKITKSPLEANRILKITGEPELLFKTSGIDYVEKELGIPMPIWYVKKYRR